MRRVPTGAVGPKNQVRSRPSRARVGAPLPIPAISAPTKTSGLGDIPLPSGFTGSNYVIKEGPTVKTMTKGIPKSLKE